MSDNAEKSTLDPKNATDPPEKSGISRRGFIAGAAGVAALFAVGGVTRAMAGESELLHPPGGQGDHFLEACIRCDRCRSACPQGAISLGHLEDGLLSTRLPVMKYSLGYCNFCEGHDGYRCVLSCPTGALTPGFDVASDKIGIAVFDTDECLLYRSGSRMCSRDCVDACPYGAISESSSGALEVDESKCNGCGACENVCPSAKYTTYDGSDKRGINVEVWEG